MLHSRSLLALLGNSLQQWQLQSILCLPPDLRVLAVRNFSSVHAAREGDDIDGTARIHDVETPKGIEPSVKTGDVYRNKNQESGSNRPARQHDSQHQLDQPVSNEARVRSIVDRQWSGNLPTPSFVRILKDRLESLDPVKDAVTRRDLIRRIKLEEWSMKGNEPRARLNKSFLQRLEPTADPQPFEEQDDPDQGFGDPTSRPSAPQTQARKRSQSKTGSEDATLNRLLVAEAKFAMIRRRPNGEDVAKGTDGRIKSTSKTTDFNALHAEIRSMARHLHRWRTDDETQTYQRLTNELAALHVDSDEGLKFVIWSRMHRLNQKAINRWHMKALEDSVRQELDSNPSTRYIIRGQHTFSSKEIERLRKTSDPSSRKTRATKADFIDLWLQQVTLHRKATIRTSLLRQRTQADIGLSSATGIPSRLAILKQALLESPDHVRDAPAIQKQLKELEDTLRASIKVHDPDSIPSTNVEISHSKATRSTRNTAKPSEVSEKQAVNNKTPVPPVIVEDIKDKSIEKHSSRQHESTPFVPTLRDGSQDLIARPQEIAIFADLRAQIQELTTLLKILVSQQATAHSSMVPASALSQILEKANGMSGAIANAGGQPSLTSSRYQHLVSNRQGQADDLADLPGEITDKAVDVAETEQETKQVKLELPTLGLSESDQSSPDQARLGLSEPQRSTARFFDMHEQAHVPSASPETAQSTTNSASSLEGTTSLYEQLFPEEAAIAARVEGSRDPLPRVPLPLQAAPAGASEALTPPTQLKSKAHVQRGRSVLILQGASKTLTEDDFRRALPRGKHLQEWTQKGKYERVIPVRDFSTLEKTGDYFIEFKNLQLANAFAAHVKRLHKLAKEHTPTSLRSDLPPAPRSLLRDGAEDESELVRNFALVEPNTTLSLIKVDRGVHAEVLTKGGYPQALPGNLTPETPQVLLEFDGGVMPNWFQIRDAIMKDGKRRALPWELILGELAIRKLTMKPPSSSVSGDIESVEGGTANELVDQDRLYDYDSGARDDDMLTQDRRENGANGQRWVIAFKDRDEAHRFARSWHMRKFQWADSENKKDRVYKGSTRMKAEVLW